MIDDSDGDFMLMLGFGGGGGGVGLVICIILAIVFYCIAADNKKTCTELECPNGEHAELVAHDCRCFDKPLPKEAGAK